MTKLTSRLSGREQLRDTQPSLPFPLRFKTFHADRHRLELVAASSTALGEI
jgi:hypothetical protein